jgi:membrane-bound lytic murein transglycosylase D
LKTLLLVTTLAGFAAGCGSSAAPRHTAAEGAPVPAPAATPAPTPTPATAPEPAAAAPAAGEIATVADNGAPSLQDDALASCERARELLDAGDAEAAIAAIDRAYELLLALPEVEETPAVQAQDDLRRLIAELLARCYRVERGVPAPMTPLDLSLAIVDNEHVQREIRSFTGYERSYFIEAYQRSGLFRPMILAKLEAAGLPSQLSWLPLVESLFKERALSRAAAVGLWQFIASTGARYGLARNAWVDERMDPEKSTDAAIAYLSELHGMFGDWPKALAAYNCGEAQVDRLSRRSAAEYQDFWDLYAMLPQETRRYVPRFFATLVIIADPARYGMALPEPLAPRPETVAVRVERAVQLDRLDAELGLAAGTLKELNPALRHAATPAFAYDLRVPAGVADAVPAHIAALPQYQPPRALTVTHRVGRGETLSTIAARYGTSVEAIMRANRIRSANKIWPGQRLEVPVRGGRTAAGAADAAAASADAAAATYTVRSGDTLSTIARRNRTSVERIKELNALASDALTPGQTLRLRPEGPSPAPTAAGVSAAGAATAPAQGQPAGVSPAAARRYQVRSGDTPAGIADAHKIKLEALLAANGLSRRSTIFPGQWLVIP